MSFQTLFTKMEDHTLIITINRPEKLNALNQQVMHDLDAVFDRVYKFPEIKSVVLTGAGLKVLWLVQISKNLKHCQKKKQLH